jgi:hypothetical protein
VKSLNDAFAPFTNAILKMAGIPKIKTREDIDRIADFLRSTGL